MIKARLGAIVLLAGLLLGGCDRAAQPTIRVATNVWPGYEPLYLARTVGYFEKTAVELVEYPSASEVMRAYENALVDAAGITLDEALLLAAARPDFTIVAVMDYSNGADAILARPPARDLSALKGRTIGLENTALGSFFLSRALQIAGIDPASVTLVPMLVDEHERAYKSGRVDAVVTFEPVRTLLLKEGAVQVFDSSQIPGEIVDVLMVRTRTLQENPKAVKALIAGWFRALAYMQENPGKAHELMSARLGISPQEAAAAYEGLALPTQTENLRALFGPNAELKAVATQMQEKLIKAGILERPVTLERLFPADSVKKLYP